MTRDGDDPDRQRAAAHELGHTFVWKAYGFPVVRTEITGHGHQVGGGTILGKHRLPNTGRAHKFLIGLLAGGEAERLWCELNAVRYSERSEEGDMEHFQGFCRDNPTLRVNVRRLRGIAGQVVRRRWEQIERLIPELAAHGKL